VAGIEVQGGGVAGIEVPALAAGGIVKTPMLAMLGEAGPEAVIPLNKASGLGGTTVIIQISDSVVTSERAMDDLAMKISERIGARVTQRIRV